MIPSIRPETPDQPDVAGLLLAADSRSASLYPAVSRHGLGVEALLAAGVRFYVARLDGRAVGCGGYALGADCAAELKRLFVTPEARGYGLGGLLVAECELGAVAERAGLMRLETGIKSVEAIGLYSKLGYRARGPFGSYRPDPLSVFMEKALPPAAR